jgi:hypothetical protein
MLVEYTMMHDYQDMAGAVLTQFDKLPTIDLGGSTSALLATFNGFYILITDTDGLKVPVSPYECQVNFYSDETMTLHIAKLEFSVHEVVPKLVEIKCPINTCGAEWTEYDFDTPVNCPECNTVIKVVLH